MAIIEKKISKVDPIYQFLDTIDLSRDAIKIELDQKLFSFLQKNHEVISSLIIREVKENDGKAAKEIKQLLIPTVVKIAQQYFNAAMFAASEMSKHVIDTIHSENPGMLLNINKSFFSWVGEAFGVKEKHKKIKVDNKDLLTAKLDTAVDKYVLDTKDIASTMFLNRVGSRQVKKNLNQAISSRGRETGALFNAATGHSQSYIFRVADQAAQEAFSFHLPKKDKEKYQWVTFFTKSCPDCIERHGQVETLEVWAYRGRPRSGQTVCRHHCHCVLLPSAYNINVERPIARVRAKIQVPKEQAPKATKAPKEQTPDRDKQKANDENLKKQWEKERRKLLDPFLPHDVPEVFETKNQNVADWVAKYGDKFSDDTSFSNKKNRKLGPLLKEYVKKNPFVDFEVDVKGGISEKQFFYTVFYIDNMKNLGYPKTLKKLELKAGLTNFGEPASGLYSSSDSVLSVDKKSISGRPTFSKNFFLEVLYHEHGHHVNNHILRSGSKKSIDLLYKFSNEFWSGLDRKKNSYDYFWIESEGRLTKKPKAIFPSDYSKKDVMETFAEAFALINTNRKQARKFMSSKAIHIFDELMEEVAGIKQDKLLQNIDSFKTKESNSHRFEKMRDRVDAKSPIIKKIAANFYHEDEDIKYKISATPNLKNRKIRVSGKGDNFEFSRTIDYGSKTATHIKTNVLGKDPKSAQKVKEFLKNSVDFYDDIGIEKIKIKADKIGSYVFAKNGFNASSKQIGDFKNQLLSKVTNAKIKKKIESAKTMMDIANLQVSREEFDENFKHLAGKGNIKTFLRRKKSLTGDNDGEVKLGKVFLLGKKWEGEIDTRSREYLVYLSYLSGKPVVLEKKPVVKEPKIEDKPEPKPDKKTEKKPEIIEPDPFEPKTSLEQRKRFINDRRFSVEDSKDILSKHNLDPKEIAASYYMNTSQGWNEYALSTEKKRGKEVIRIDGEGPDMTFTRYINLTDKKVKHDRVVIWDKEKRGSGQVKEWLSNSVELYDKLGIKEIGLNANISVGGYLWAKVGFRASEKTIKTYKRDLLKLAKNQDTIKKIKATNSMLEIANLEISKDEFISDFRTVSKFDGQTTDRSIEAGAKYLEDSRAVKGETAKLGKAFLLGRSWDGTIKTDSPEYDIFLSYVSGKPTKRK